MDFAIRRGLDPAQRLQMLEDAEEIRWMKAYYAQVCDDKFTEAHVARPQDEIDAMMRPMVERVFAEDAVWDGSPGGAPPIVGRAAIFERLRLSAWTFAMHYYVNPLITLAGDTAHARWMLWETCTVAEGNQALWMSAVSEEDYRRTPDGWRLCHYAVRYKFLTPFDRPWTDRSASLLPRT
jgi:hypothetical protein